MGKIGGKKPGTAALAIGTVLFAFGGLIVLGTLGRTESTVAYVAGRFTTVEQWVGPAPLAILLAVVGAAILGFGIYKRRTA